MTNNDTKMIEPMSKEEMIDTLKGLVFSTFDRTTTKEREALILAIKALEQTMWTPTTEKLPEFHQEVLLSLRSLNVTDGCRSGIEPYFYCYDAYIEPQNVLAWMPLPKPYKEEQDGKNNTDND